MGQENNQQTQSGGQSTGTDPNAAAGTTNSILDAGGEGAVGQQGQGQQSGDILDAGGNTDGTNNNSGGQSAPEKYEPFKLGDDIVMADKQYESFSQVAKGLNLTQDQAQKLVDYQSTIVKEGHETQLQESKDLIETWKAETIQMLGENRQAKTDIANQALGQRPELRAVLAQTGLLNHPEIVKLMVDYGKITSEDVLVDGKPSGKSTLPREQVLYGNM